MGLFTYLSRVQVTFDTCTWYLGLFENAVDKYSLDSSTSLMQIIICLDSVCELKVSCCW